MGVVHAQDGGGVEGDYGVAGELAEEYENRRDEYPRGGDPAARRSPRLDTASDVLALALKWVGSRKCCRCARICFINTSLMY